MFAAELETLAEGLVRPDEDARSEARAALRRLAAGAEDGPGGPTPPRDGTYGRLGDVAVWLAGVQGRCPPDQVRRPLLVVLGDRSRAPADVERIAATGAGALRVLALAAAGRTPMGEDADEAVADAVRAGGALADTEADEGTDLLLLAAPAASSAVPAAILVAALSGLDAPSVVGSAGVDDATWMRACVAVRDGLRRARPFLGESVGLLAAAGGTDLAMLSGLLLRAAARRTPVVLDGTTALAAALFAQRCAHDASEWWLVAHADADPAAVEVLRHLDLTPVLDLGLRGRPGPAAALAMPLIRAAAGLLTEPCG
jgi:nicotinate-nucleotide--dimethylbenzimidazole phosphoribosyltransferase